jgi:SAM-dependent methyltransferase
MEKIRKHLSHYSFLVFIYHAAKKTAAYPGFIRDFFAFRRLSAEPRFSIKASDAFPCLLDKTAETSFEPHYIYHPAWAARVVAKINPEKHIDISSTLHFCTMLSAFVPVDFYDYRPARLNLSDLESKRGDLMHLPFEDNSVESISCLHTIEHIGLGRYGDPLDPDGDIKAINELIRVVKPGGSLIFVTPIGKPRIEFNAHRIYSYEQIQELFKEVEMKEFSLVPDNFKELGLVANATKELADKQTWGCGCFWFIKK